MPKKISNFLSINCDEQLELRTLGEKLHFSTMFSTISQLSFIVENITFNYKMFFATQKRCCQLISKIVDNVELTLQHS
jgi:hypothetical protein